jgi:hypothetical protein
MGARENCHGRGAVNDWLVMRALLVERRELGLFAHGS